MGTEGSVSPVTAVVLCGGGGVRFGGDKTAADLGGRTVLDTLLDSLPTEWDVVCVGPERPTTRAVQWCREDPPGGGPVAGLATGATDLDAEIVVVLGGDMPYAAVPAQVLARTLAARPDVKAAAVVDGEGRIQPLLAAYRLVALRSVLPADPAGARLTPLLRSLDPLGVEVADGTELDIDTPADLERARRRVGP